MLKLKNVFESNNRDLDLNIKNRIKESLVVFNKQELKILNSIKPTLEMIEKIKQIKKIFGGELVS